MIQVAIGLLNGKIILKNEMTTEPKIKVDIFQGLPKSDKN